jgi:cytochrome b561
MEPVPLKRVFFWATYLFGTVTFIFGLLLTQVPRGRNDMDFLLDLATWGGCFCILVICLLLMRRISSARCSGIEGKPGGAYYLFSLLGAAELCFCVYALAPIFIEIVSH